MAISTQQVTTQRRAGRIVGFLSGNQLMVIGFVLTLVVVLMAVFAPYIATHDPLRTDVRNRLQPPSSERLMGTDAAGRDVFSRVVHGARVSVRVGAAVVALTTVFGIILGILAGYYRKVDGLIMRTMDGLMAFPSIFLAIAILAALGPRESNVIIALTITITPNTARVVRGVVLGLREMDYVMAALASGASDLRVLARHILPNTLAPVIVQGTFVLGVAVLAEAGLSFVGAGTQPPTPSWGNMLADAQTYIYHAPWMSIFPGVLIMLAVLGLNLLGDGLRDYLDPRMRGVR